MKSLATETSKVILTKLLFAKNSPQNISVAGGSGGDLWVEKQSGIRWGSEGKDWF